MKVHNNTTHSVVLPRKTAANNAKDLAKSLVADAVKATISDEGKRLNQKIYHDDGLPATESVLADRDAKKKDIAAKKERISDLMDKDKSIITDEIEKLRKESTTTEDKLYALYDSKAVWEKRKDSSSGDAAVALGVIDFYQKEIDKTKDILDKEARDDSKNQLKAVQERADKEAEEKKTPVAESQDVGVETLRQADISTLKAENGLLENIAKEKS